LSYQSPAAWIRVDTTFWGDPKFAYVREHLGLSENELIAFMLRLWDLAGRRAPRDGILANKPEWISYECKWKSFKLTDPKKVIKGLIDAGLLDRENGGLQVHNWTERQPLAKNAKKQRIYRAEHKTYNPPEMGAPEITGNEITAKEYEEKTGEKIFKPNVDNSRVGKPKKIGDLIK
jgi:hypothetical protein